MKNLGNRNFGIPLPLSRTNPYQLSARAALKGEVSIPEGPLALVGNDLIVPWMAKLSTWLRTHGQVIYFQQQAMPVAKFVPSVMDFFAQKALRLPLREFDSTNPPPSLEDVAKLVQERASQHPLLYDFSSFLEDHLETQELQALLKKYPCLALGN